LKLTGTLVTVYPHDVRTAEFDLKEKDGKRTQSIDGITFTLAGDTVSAAEEILSGTQREFRYWLFDSNGGWMHQRGSLMVSSDGSGQSDSPWTTRDDGPRPARLVVVEFVGEDTVEVPFAIDSIRVPAIPE
jgi:hypothetical protein